jgi:hypothetical protein
MVEIHETLNENVSVEHDYKITLKGGPDPRIVPVLITSSIKDELRNHKCYIMFMND